MSKPTGAGCCGPGLALGVLAALASGCQAAKPREAAPPPATSPSTRPEAGPASAPPAAPRESPSALPQDAHRHAALLACRRGCYEPGKRCFATCYRYGHPRDPQGHERCNEACRQSHGIPECEAQCARAAR